MEVQQKKSWEPWQVRTIGFSLPWWFAVAPSFGAWLWHQLSGSAEPLAPLEMTSWLSYLMIPVGILSAVVVLVESDDCDYRRAARWFLFGTLAMPALVALTLTSGSTL